MTADFVGRGWRFPPSTNAHGSVALSDSQEEIEQAIFLILSTAPGERVMRPTFGSRLHELVFDPIHAETMARARRFVQEALNMWEPRITILGIDVYPARNTTLGCILIDIQYQVKGTNDKRNLVYPFYVIPGE